MSARDRRPSLPSWDRQQVFAYVPITCDSPRGVTQSAMLVTELFGHMVVVVEHVSPHIGTDRPWLDE